MNFQICATDLPVITGHNPYKPKEEIYLKFWKKYYPFDFEKFTNYLKEKNIEMKKEETNYETIKRIVKENNINIGSNLSKCLKSNDIGDLNKNKNEVLKIIETQLPSNKKQEFKKSFNSFTNTNFGIKSSVLANFLQSNDVNFAKASSKPKSNSSLGKIVTDATYYLSCWMTMAQIKNVKSEKVLFSNFK